MPGENALERLKSIMAEEGVEQQYTMDEIINSREEIIDGMSREAEEAMISKTQEDAEDTLVEENQSLDTAEQTIEKTESKPKPERVVKTIGKRNKTKKEKNKQEEFFNDIANECVNIMIQSGVVVHDFSQDQMNIIWDYIKNKLNN